MENYMVTSMEDNKILPWKILAIGLLILSTMLVLQYLGDLQDIYWILVLLWISSMCVIFVPAVYHLEICIPRIKPFIPLFLILVTLFYIRVYDLENIPAYFHVDEGIVGLRAKTIINGNERLFFQSGYYWLPNSCFTISVLTQRIFGNTIFGARISSVFMGALSLLGIFLFTNKCFGKITAYISTIMMGVSYTHVHFSRIAGPYIFPVTFGGFIGYLLFYGYSGNKYLNTVCAGLITGLALQTYNASRALPVIVIIFLVLHLPFSKNKEIGLKKILVYIIGGIIGMGPVLLLVIQDFPGFMARNNQVSVLSGRGYEHSSRAYNTRNKMKILAIQLKKTVGMFHFYGDNSAKFNIKKPLVDPIVAVLMVLGLGVMVIRIHSPPYYFLAIWMIVILVGGGVLTTNAPFFPRILGILPPVYILASFIPGLIYKQLKTREMFREFLLPEVFIVTLMSLVCFYNIKTYFIDYKTYTTIDQPTAIARFIKNSGSMYRYYFLTAPQIYPRHRGITFMLGNKFQTINLLDPSTFFCSRREIKNSVFIINPENSHLAPLLKYLLPGAIYKKHGLNKELFTSLTVDETSLTINTNCIKRILMEKEAGKWVTRKEDSAATIMYKNKNGKKNSSIQVKWEGETWFPVPGTYRFATIGNSSNNWSLNVDEKELHDKQLFVSPGATGWKKFVVTCKEIREKFQLAWIPPGEKIQLILPAYLRSSRQN